MAKHISTSAAYHAKLKTLVYFMRAQPESAKTPFPGKEIFWCDVPREVVRSDDFTRKPAITLVNTLKHIAKLHVSDALYSNTKALAATPGSYKQQINDNPLPLFHFVWQCLQLQQTDPEQVAMYARTVLSYAKCPPGLLTEVNNLNQSLLPSGIVNDFQKHYWAIFYANVNAHINKNVVIDAMVGLGSLDGDKQSKLNWVHEQIAHIFAAIKIATQAAFGLPEDQGDQTASTHRVLQAAHAALMMRPVNGEQPDKMPFPYLNGNDPKQLKLILSQCLEIIYSDAESGLLPTLDDVLHAQVEGIMAEKFEDNGSETSLYALLSDIEKNGNIVARIAKIFGIIDSSGAYTALVEQVTNATCNEDEEGEYHPKPNANSKLKELIHARLLKRYYEACQQRLGLEADANLQLPVTWSCGHTFMVEVGAGTIVEPVEEEQCSFVTRVQVETGTIVESVEEGRLSSAVTMKSIISAITAEEAARRAFEEATRQALDKATQATHRINQLVSETVNQAEQAAKEVADQARQAARRACQVIGKESQVAEQAGQLAEQAGQLAEQAGQLAGQVKQLVSEATAQATQAIKHATQAVERLKQAVGKAAEGASEIASRTAEQASQAVEQASQAVEQALNQAVVRPLEQLKNQVNQIAKDVALQEVQQLFGNQFSGDFKSLKNDDYTRAQLKNEVSQLHQPITKAKKCALLAMYLKLRFQDPNRYLRCFLFWKGCSRQAKCQEAATKIRDILGDKQESMQVVTGWGSVSTAMFTFPRGDNGISSKVSRQGLLGRICALQVECPSSHFAESKM